MFAILEHDGCSTASEGSELCGRSLPSEMATIRSPKRIFRLLYAAQRAGGRLAGLSPLTDDCFVVSRSIDVEQAATIVNRHIHEPIAPRMDDGSRP